MSAYRGSRTTPRQGRPVLAIGLIAGLAIALGFILGSIFNRDDGETAGGSPSASASASAPASGSASIAPSAVASASASAAPAASAPAPVVAAPGGVIPPGSVVRVLTDGLRMRERPSTESTLVDNLPVDQLLLVGYAAQRSDWGPIQRRGLRLVPGHPAGRADRSAATLRRPTRHDQCRGLGCGRRRHGGLHPAPRPALPAPTGEPGHPGGDAALGTARVLRPGADHAGGNVRMRRLRGHRPRHVRAGLARTTDSHRLPVGGPERTDRTVLRCGSRPTGRPPPTAGQILRVVGHFDDPAAGSCAISPGEPPVPLDPLVAALYCREQFVVESIEVTGTDPDFP